MQSLISFEGAFAHKSAKISRWVGPGFDSTPDISSNARLQECDRVMPRRGRVDSKEIEFGLEYKVASVEVTSSKPEGIRQGMIFGANIQHKRLIRSKA